MTPAMTPERWQQIKHLVNSALQADSQSRTALLQQSCADDFALRIGAEALLSVTRRLPEQPLSPDAWQRIEQLFQSALELEPAKRAAFLAQACGDDDALRHEVESLLVYQGAAGGVIQGAVHVAGRAKGVRGEVAGRVNSGKREAPGGAGILACCERV